MEQAQIKSFLVVFVSSVWLLAITVPSILQLLDKDGQCITFTLNEEETEEQEKIDNGEEIILADTLVLKYLLIPRYSDKADAYNTTGFNSFSVEIQLPPPEDLS